MKSTTLNARRRWRNVASSNPQPTTLIFVILLLYHNNEIVSYFRSISIITFVFNTTGSSGVARI